MKGFKFNGRIYKLVEAPKENECTGCALDNGGDCRHHDIAQVWDCAKDRYKVAEDVTETLKKL